MVGYIRSRKPSPAEKSVPRTHLPKERKISVVMSKILRSGRIGHFAKVVLRKIENGYFGNEFQSGKNIRKATLEARYSCSIPKKKVLENHQILA